MNARGIGAAFFCGGVFVVALAVRSFAEAMVSTWNPTLTIVVVMFGGVALVIVAIGVGAGVRLALADRRETARPIIVQSAPHTPLLPDSLRDAERLQRILRLGARGENGTVPAFEAGQFIDYDGMNG